MARLLVVAFAALAFSASAGVPESTVSSVGESVAKREAPPAATHVPKPTKEELAEQAHEEAQKAHDAAFSHAEKAMEKAQAWLGAIGDSTVAKELAEAIAADTEKGAAKQAAAADEHFKHGVAAVADSGRDGDEKAVEAAMKHAKEALEEEKAVGHEAAEAMRAQMKDLEEDEKSQAKEMTKEPKDAAHAAAHTAKDLEKTARHAGVSEKHYEGDYGHDEHAFEKLEDKSGDMKGKAQDKIEKFFEEVERALEPRMDAARHQGLSHAEEEEDRNELEAAEEHAQEEVKKIKESARAAKKAQEENMPEAEKEASAEKKAEAEKEEEEEDAEAKKEASPVSEPSPGANSGAPARGNQRSARAARAEKTDFLAATGTAPGPAAPAVALFLLAALAAYAMVPRRRTVGMAPPLLG